MIPTSYFYKELFRRHWLEAVPEVESRAAIEAQLRSGRPLAPRASAANILGAFAKAVAALVRGRPPLQARSR